MGAENANSSTLQERGIPACPSPMANGAPSCRSAWPRNGAIHTAFAILCITRLCARSPSTASNWCGSVQGDVGDAAARAGNPALHAIGTETSYGLALGHRHDAVSPAASDSRQNVATARRTGATTSVCHHRCGSGRNPLAAKAARAVALTERSAELAVPRGGSAPSRHYSSEAPARRAVLSRFPRAWRGDSRASHVQRIAARPPTAAPALAASFRRPVGTPAIPANAPRKPIEATSRTRQLSSVMAPPLVPAPEPEPVATAPPSLHAEPAPKSKPLQWAPLQRSPKQANAATEPPSN